MTNEYCNKCGVRWDSDYQSHTCPPTDLKADLQRLDAAYRSWCQNCTTDNMFRLANASRESQPAAVLQRLEELEAENQQLKQEIEDYKILYGDLSARHPEGTIHAKNMERISPLSPPSTDGKGHSGG